jgi:hypothetical protein
MKEVYLYFNNADSNGQIDTAHDVYCVPVSKFRGMTNVGTSRTELSLMFAPIEGEIELATNAYPADVSDVITLTVTQDKADDVAKALIAAFNAGPHATGSVIVIADDSASEYFHADITGCAPTVQAAAAA